MRPAVCFGLSSPLLFPHCPFSSCFPSSPSFSPHPRIFPPSLLSSPSLTFHFSPPSPASSPLCWQNISQWKCGVRFCPFCPFLSHPFPPFPSPSLPSPSLFFSLSVFLLFVFRELKSMFDKDLYSPCQTRRNTPGGGNWQKANLAFRRPMGSLPASETQYNLGGFIFLSCFVFQSSLP